MLDIRYHIASLTAVFLALGFGILIGSSYAGPAAIRRMSVQIERQNQRLDDAVQLNEHDHELLRVNEDAIAALVPHLVQNQLAGKRIALIQTGDYSDGAKDASQAIAQAGGTVTSTTTLTDRFAMLSGDDRQGLAKALGASGDDDSSLLKPLALALLLGTATHPNLASEVSTLSQAGVIDTSGDLTAPVDMVVLIGGEATAPDTDSDSAPTHEEEIIALLKTPANPQGKTPTVVGCETLDAVQSSVPAFLRAGVASVDCIDEPIGALDLPYALNGDNSAYGVKPTSDRLIPQALAAPAPSA